MSFPRYPKYKDSGIKWLGDVPAHWEVTSIKRFATLQRGYDLTDAERKEGNYPVVTSGGITGSHDSFMVRGPGVVTGRYGSTGRLFFIEDNFWPHNTALYVSDFHGNHPRFVWYSLQTVDFAAHSAKAAVPGVDRNDIHVLPVAVPSLDEQRSVIAYLDHATVKMDALIAEQHRLIELLKEKRQAAISQAVIKGLNPDVPMKPSRVDWLGDVPMHWEVKKLRFLCDVQTGGRDTEDAVDGGRYPFFVRSQTVEHIDTASFDCEAVLTAGDGVGVGKVFHYYQGAFDFHQRVYMLNNFRGVSGRFLFHFLKTNFYKVALEGGAKSTVDSLRRPMFMNFWVCVPPPDEQGRIVMEVDRVAESFDALSAEAQRAIDLLQERRAALISAAVTGQIDVRAIADRVAA